MHEFVLDIAGFAIGVESLFETTGVYCREYWTGREPEFFVTVRREDLVQEQALLDAEADEDGLKRRKFPDPFLERSVIQRRVAEHLLKRDVLLMHGSTVAVDGRAYLFTAACGTGKSTHTRLWREVFGDRAVMVNDDKPFLKLTENSVIACGAPWTGKHGIGTNCRLPLGGICILRRGAENVIRPAQRDEVEGFLLHQIFQCEGREALTKELADRLLSSVPLWEMECNKDHQAAEIAYGAMRNN